MENHKIPLQLQFDVHDNLISLFYTMKSLEIIENVLSNGKIRVPRALSIEQKTSCRRQRGAGSTSIRQRQHQQLSFGVVTLTSMENPLASFAS